MWWVKGITPGLIILLLKRILFFKRRGFDSLDYSGREVETASGLVFTRTDNLLNWTLGALSHHVRSQMTYLRDQRKDRPWATWKEIEAKEAPNWTQSCLHVHRTRHASEVILGPLGKPGHATIWTPCYPSCHQVGLKKLFILAWVPVPQIAWDIIKLLFRLWVNNVVIDNPTVSLYVLHKLLCSHNLK